MAATLLVLVALSTPACSTTVLERDLKSLAGPTKPIMKVVAMLEDMKTELNKELEDDKAVYEQLMCWCTTGKQDKKAAIEMANANIGSLTATMGEAAGKIEESKSKRKATMDEMYADQKGLGEATAQRMSDNQAFHGEETDLLDAISAAKGAVTALSKHHPDFAQVRKVALKLSEARAVLRLADSSLGHSQMKELKSFLQASKSATSFLSIPGMQSYAPQSGQIFGILKQMQEDFETNLAASQASEAKAVKEYEMLKAAKQDEIATAQKLSIKQDADIAEFTEKHAQAASELEDTEQQLADDTEFLAALEKKCASAEAEFAARTKARNEEISAVEDTIQYLNSDEAYAAFDKNVNTKEGSNTYSATDFIQVSAKSTEKEPEKRERAAALLQNMAGEMASPQLALVAAKVSGRGAFDSAIGDIHKMVEQLHAEQKAEIKLRDYCVSELNTARRAEAHGYDDKDALTTKIGDLTKTVEQLTTDIKTSKDTIVETMKQMKRSGETREIENLDYQQVVQDQAITQAILTKALERMKEVYALMQERAPHTATSATRTDPGNGPAKFTKYEQNAGGKRVVAMIEEVIADAKKTEDEAHASEADAQSAYEYFVKESNKSITQLTTSINDMTVSLAKAKEDLTMAKSDIGGTMKELEGLHDYMTTVHRECDYELKNFKIRQEALAREMDGLREAEQILGDAAP